MLYSVTVILPLLITIKFTSSVNMHIFLSKSLRDGKKEAMPGIYVLQAITKNRDKLKLEIFVAYWPSSRIWWCFSTEAFSSQYATS